MSSSSSADDKLPLGYIVSHDLLRAYATKQGLTESPQTDILEDAMSALKRRLARGGIPMARIVPVWNASYTGEELYMQVSGWEGCERGTDWKVEEEVEKAYCMELGLKFREGRATFKPIGYYEP